MGIKNILYIMGIILMIGLVGADLQAFDDTNSNNYSIYNISNVSSELYCYSGTCYTLAELAETGAGNASFNQSLTDGLYIAQSDESNLNVNSSDYWDTFNTANTTQISNSGGVLNIMESWLTTFWNSVFSTKTTDDLTEGTTNLYDNQTWNESKGNDLYVNGDGDTMTGNLSFADSFIYNPNYVEFNITYSDGTAEGRLQWNSEEGALEVGLPGGNVNLQIGQEVLIRAKNTQGVQINNGQVGYISGATGSLPTVGLANPSNHTQADTTLAVATEDCANNANCFFTTTGLVRDVDTSAFSAGELLYLSEGGNFSNVKPGKPNITVTLGNVVTSHASTGIIFVSIDTIHTLSELSDVMEGQSNNSIYYWDADSELWRPTETPLFENVTVTDSIIQNGYSIKKLDNNSLVTGEQLGVIMGGPDGVNSPHFWIQPGGPGQASGIARSFMIVNENDTILNSVNRTSCQTWANEFGDTLQIDCNTTTTGADLLVGDDMQVFGDVWLKSSDGFWKFISRTLSLIDRTNSNLLLNKVNSTLSGTNFSFIDEGGETLIVNLGSQETITEKTVDSITITQGTNITPQKNYIYYTTPGNPTLTVAAAEPTGNVAEVGRFIQGNGYTYGSVIDDQSEQDAFRNIFTRFFDQGPLYVSGYDQAASSTQINFTGGTMNVVAQRSATTNVLDTSTGFFYVNSTGNYVQATDLSDITEYSDGVPIGNNKFFNVVFGIVHNDLGNTTMTAVIQTGTSEYITTTGAETDGDRLARFFPSDGLLKNMYLPVARVVMKRQSSVNTIQTLSTGQLFIDERGITSSAGAAGSPSITDHSQLSNLNWASAGHTFDENLTVSGFDVIANKFYGLFNWTVNSAFASFDGSTLEINDTLLNETYVNVNGDTMTGNLNLSNANLTISNLSRTCYDGPACTKYMYYNGSNLIIQG